MGRSAEPIPLKILKGRGNGKDVAGRPIPAAPKFDRGAPQPPEWLSGEARAEWDRTAPELDRLGLLKPEDLTAFAAYCTTWARFVDAVTQYQREGITVANSRTGNSMKNPAVAIAEVSATQLLRYANDFGLTAASEQKVARVTDSDGDDSDDPFA